MARTLLSILALLALLAAPLGMTGGGAEAMPHHQFGMMADHMNGMSHHQEQGGEDKAAIDCMIACAALPAVAPPSMGDLLIAAAVPAPLPLEALRSTFPEAETPPPRSA